MSHDAESETRATIIELGHSLTGPQSEGSFAGVGRRHDEDDRRSCVVKALEPEKNWKKQIPEWRLRNALAHDIGAVLIEDGEVSFEDPGRAFQKRMTGKLFDGLIGYANRNLW